MTPRPSVLLSRSPVRFVFAALLSLVLVTHALGTPVKFDIPAQPAATALQLFIKQSGTQVAFAPDEIKDAKANALAGEHEPAAALALLLKNTGLVFKPREPGWFVVTRPAAKPGSVQGTLLTPGGRSVEGVRVTVAETGDAALIWEGHRAGREIGYSHLEKLGQLDQVPADGFQVVCFPVKVHRGSAGWTRAVAIIEE